MFSHIRLPAACALLWLLPAAAEAGMYDDCNAAGAGPAKIEGCRAVIAAPGLRPATSYVPAYRRLCKAYAKDRRWSEGLAACNEYFGAYPSKVRAADYIIRGVILNGLERKEEAVADYTKSIGMQPKIWQAYYDRGLAYYEMKNYGAALADLSKAIELNPESAVARFNRGLIHKRMGNAELARTDFTAALAKGMPRARKALDRLLQGLPAVAPFAQQH